MAGRSNIVVRPARVRDAGVLADLLGQLGYPSDAAAVRRRLRALRALRAMGGKQTERVIVAVVNGRVAGLASLHVTPCVHQDQPIGRITALVVDGGHRQRGIGARLMQAMEQAAIDAGCDRLELTSSEHRDAAHAFYPAMGYVAKRRGSSNR